MKYTSIPEDHIITLMDEILAGATGSIYRSIYSDDEAIAKNKIIEFAHDYNIGVLLKNGNLQINYKTKEFLDNGGFQEYYKQKLEALEESDRIENLRKKKLEQDTLINQNLITYYENRNKRRFWTIMLSAILSVSVAVISDIIIVQLRSPKEQVPLKQNIHEEKLSTPKNVSIDSVEVKK